MGWHRSHEGKSWDLLGYLMQELLSPLRTLHVHSPGNSNRHSDSRSCNGNHAHQGPQGRNGRCRCTRSLSSAQLSLREHVAVSSIRVGGVRARRQRTTLSTLAFGSGEARDHQKQHSELGARRRLHRRSQCCTAVLLCSSRCPAVAASTRLCTTSIAPSVSTDRGSTRRSRLELRVVAPPEAREGRAAERGGARNGGSLCT